MYRTGFISQGSAVCRAVPLHRPAMYLAVPHVLPFHLLSLLVKLGAMQVPQPFVFGKICSPFSAESSNQISHSQFCDISE